MTVTYDLTEEDIGLLIMSVCNYLEEIRQQLSHLRLRDICCISDVREREEALQTREYYIQQEYKAVAMKEWLITG